MKFSSGLVLAVCLITLIQPTCLVRAQERVLTPEEDRLVAEYYYGDPRALAVSMTLRKDGTFTINPRFSGTPQDEETGTFRLENGVLILSPQGQFVGWDRLRPVSWGYRLYLVPEEQGHKTDTMMFINEVNMGIEPRQGDTMGFLFLRKGDEAKAVSGAPDLPEKWKGYILPSPSRRRYCPSKTTGSCG